MPSPIDTILDPGANLGWWSQLEVQHAAKSRDNDGDGEDDEDGDDEDDDDEDDDEDAEKSEDELRAELKAVRASLSKASGSSKSKRDTIKRLKAELAEAVTSRAKPTKKDDEDDDKPDLDAVRAAAKAEARAESDARLKRSEIRGALRAYGVPKERIARAANLVSLDDLEVDDNGEVDGLDEALDEVRRDFPELFPKSRKRRSVAGDEDRDGKEGGGGKNLSASELQARAALGRARR